MDEDLLGELDQHPAVKELGRSAVLRQAAAEFLARSARAEIARKYAAGYSGAGSFDEGFEGWHGEEIWPAE